MARACDREQPSRRFGPWPGRTAHPRWGSTGECASGQHPPLTLDGCCPCPGGHRVEPPQPARIPGRLRSQGPLTNPDVLFEPITADGWISWESSALLPILPSHDGSPGLPARSPCAAVVVVQPGAVVASRRRTNGE
jgi:hypothetical protein